MVSIQLYQDTSAGECCHVYILDTYLAKLPPNVKELDIFYFRPNHCSGDDSVWLGNKSNHSLRAYAATELFQAGIPEKVIQDWTGHRSLDGLSKYERISEKQKEAACKALCVAPKPIVEECVTGMHNSMSIQNCSNDVTFNKLFYPGFSFGSASLYGCTIIVHQTPCKPDNWMKVRKVVIMKTHYSSISHITLIIIQYWHCFFCMFLLVELI